jgi:hypothetical protein
MEIHSFEVKLAQSESEPLRAIQAVNKTGQILVAFTRSVILTNSQGEICCRWDLPESMHNVLILEIHCYENYAAIVESKGLNGVVFATDDPKWQMELSRKDYHSGNCTWPIGFFKRDSKVNLIHATLWNRIDFTELKSGNVLTAREVDYEKKKNYLDYFHSSLYVSPDEQHFVVNGWCWSPWDVLYSWNIDQFNCGFEPGGNCLDMLERSGYNWDRPCCFIDNDTIAWGYNEREACEPGVPDHQGTELIFQNIHSKELTQRMPFEFFDLLEKVEARGRLWFDSQKQIFVCSSEREKKASQLPVEQRGTSIVDTDGKELHHWQQIAQFVSAENQMIGFVTGRKIKIVEYDV